VPGHEASPFELRQHAIHGRQTEFLLCGQTSRTFSLGDVTFSPTLRRSWRSTFYSTPLVRYDAPAIIDQIHLVPPP
jgi:hypothetical protein